YRIDLSERGKPDVVADAGRIPFKDGSVDAVILCEVLEHVSDPAVVIAEIVRVLRPSGTLCGSVPFVMPVHKDPGDYYRFTGDGLGRLLGELTSVVILPHGNHLGAAWRLLASAVRVLQILNPVMRTLSARADP